MKGNRWIRMLKFVPFGVAFVALFGLLAMALWNWLAPTLFGLKAIGYWQALGLVLLCRILFGGRGFMSHDGAWRHRIAERWDRMSPEERERFRQGFLGRWGHVPPPEPGPSE
jgi:hypothetical protein